MTGYPQGYPPPGYPQQGYGYYPQQGYGYYPPPLPGPRTLKPGVVSLRPLTLSDIFNGAISYVRLNPGATLGITAVVVIIAQLLALLIQIGPLAALGALEPSTFSASGGQNISDSALVGSVLTGLAGTVMTVIAGIVLSGLLTVVVGRAVFGAKITAGQTWRRARGRLLPLLAFTFLEVLAVVVATALAVGVTVVAGYAVGVGAAVAVGIVAFLALTVLFVWGGTLLVFAPAAVVLERVGIVDAVARSVALVRKDFWRVLGIWLLSTLVAGVIAGAVSIPFSVVGQVVLLGGESSTGVIVALVLITIGGAIGQIITAPFAAGVVVLLYTDRRIRGEAFDLVLQSGATHAIGDSGEAVDQLWLTTRRL